MLHPALVVIDGLGHYTYRNVFNTIADFQAGSIVTPDPIRITKDSDFICIAINVLARFRAGSVSGVRGAVIGINGAVAAAGELPDAPFLVKLKTTGDDREMQNDPIDAWEGFGVHGGLRGGLALPKLFESNTDIQIEYTLLKTAGNVLDSLRIELQLVGYKVYDPKFMKLTQTLLSQQLSMPEGSLEIDTAARRS